MLAGILTESQYKEKIEEIDSYGKVGKSYPAPSTPEPIKKINRIISDIPRKKIFTGKSSKSDANVIYFDDNDPFYSPLKEYNEEDNNSIECLNRISNMVRFPRPISENPNVTPLDTNVDLRSLYRIIAGASPLIPLKRCPNYMKDEDGEYILIEPLGVRFNGYISRGNVGSGLKKGTDYNLGMGFIFTLLDF
jgi:hypothetical protein